MDWDATQESFLNFNFAATRPVEHFYKPSPLKAAAGPKVFPYLLSPPIILERGGGVLSHSPSSSAENGRADRETPAQATRMSVHMGRRVEGG